jgi:hypothetical protein
MIVNPTAAGWEVIYHRAHALMAAEIALHWNTDERPERLAETITAIAQHDDLEREWQGNNLSPAGAPLDFTLNEKPLSFVEPWQRLISGGLYRGRWVALLTSMHVCFLTAPARGEDTTLDAFIEEQLKQQAAWRKQLGVTKQEAERSYAFLQWCDRLSLILCQRQIPERERWLEISPGPDGTRHDLLQRPDETLVVRPWPFRQGAFEVGVDTVILNQLSFASNDELVAALQGAPVERLSWRFVK